MIYLSIVIPFYNAEPTLRRCLDSIVAQQLPADEVEVILVNDGSTDGSMSLCEAYAMRHPWMRILNTWHQGQGHARNYGMDAARGKYVMFVDADDALSTTPVTGRSHGPVGRSAQSSYPPRMQRLPSIWPSASMSAVRT